MEFPEEDRRISLMLLPDDYDAPENLEKGQLIITPNTYFIGIMCSRYRCGINCK